ncbi:MAG TPA: hypothetical protein PKC29_07065 [Thermodesulfobacteriota bacterium]|nr:hypothetical protein [Thermodesulfobacteriota bacterium]
MREELPAEGLRMAVCPLPVTIIGGLTGTEGGPALGFSAGDWALLAFMPNDEGRVRLYSTDYPGITEFSLGNLKTPARGDWGRYAVWAARTLRDRYGIETGFTGVLSLPRISVEAGGHAAESMLLLIALGAVNGIGLSPKDAAGLAKEMDDEYAKSLESPAWRAIAAHGRKGSLLYADTATGNAVHYPGPEREDAFRIMTVYSGMPAGALTDVLRARTGECRNAAGFLGIMGGLRSAPTLSHVPEKVFAEKSGKLPEELRRRASHFYAESSRAVSGAAAWKAGDLVKLGRLMNESTESTLNNYEAGDPAVRSLVEIMGGTDGVYGCAYDGGVSLTGLVHKDFPEEAGEGILKVFADRHPEPGDKAAVYFSGTGDGLRIV